MKTKWIKTLNEMPMHNSDVLVSDGERIGIGNYQKSIRQHPDTGKYGYWSLQGTVFFEPTLWMELPEVPEEQPNEDFSTNHH